MRTDPLECLDIDSNSTSARRLRSPSRHDEGPMAELDGRGQIIEWLGGAKQDARRMQFETVSEWFLAQIDHEEENAKEDDYGRR